MSEPKLVAEGLNTPISEERMANIQAPPEEMKAFTAGLRVGYKQGFAAGYAQRVAEEQAEIVEPSEVLFNKPKTFKM